MGFSLDQIYAEEKLISGWKRVSGPYDPSNNFGSGYEFIYRHLKEEVEDAIRIEIEKWDSLDTLLIQ